VHEFGLASEPVVEQLIQEVRGADIVHLDETPWYQKENCAGCGWRRPRSRPFSASAAAERRKLIELIGEAFLGWLVTDGTSLIATIAPPAMPGASDSQSAGARRRLLRRQRRLR